MVSVVEIQVTQDDINSGVRYSTCMCPVALAVGRKLDRPVSADYPFIKICDERPFKVRTPERVLMFMNSFDCRIVENKRVPMEPFTFAMPIFN